MLVRRAKNIDLPAIRALSAEYGHKLGVDESHLNSRDLALVAYAESGELAGFMWAGLMASSKVAYLDKVMVSRKFNGKGVHNLLAREILDLMHKRGVRQAFGVIKQDEFHDASAYGALKMAMGADPVPYTYVQADVLNSVAEVRLMGVSNGR